MQKQIEQLNGTVANLTQAVTGLQGRIGTIQEPDLSGAIAGIQGATDAINALAQPAVAVATPGAADSNTIPTANGTIGSAAPVSTGNA